MGPVVGGSVSIRICLVAFNYKISSEALFNSALISDIDNTIVLVVSVLCLRAHSFISVSEVMRMSTVQLKV